MVECVIEVSTKIRIERGAAVPKVRGTVRDEVSDAWAVHVRDNVRDVNNMPEFMLEMLGREWHAKHAPSHPRCNLCPDGVA